MYKYRSKYDAVKLYSAWKDTDTDLSIGIQTSQFSCAGIEGTCWLPSIWCWKLLYPYIPKKNVMDTWPANIWQQLPSNISNLYCWTQCYTKGPYKEGELQTNPRCCFHCPTVLYPWLGAESIRLLNDVSSLQWTDSKKIPTLLRHQDWVHCLSFPTLQHQRQILQELYIRKLNSVQQYLRRCEVTGLPMFYWLLYTWNRGKY
jgi:hypothetical protein